LCQARRILTRGNARRDWGGGVQSRGLAHRLALREHVPLDPWEGEPVYGPAEATPNEGPDEPSDDAGE